MIRHRRILAGLAALVLLHASAAHAAESYDNCTGFIDSVPAAITTQGVWCLRKDLSTSLTSSTAIVVNTNNVTIDCNDFKLGGLTAGSATLSVGISASNRQNITVRQCNIRGFHTGVKLSGNGHLVEDNRFNGNTYMAIDVVGDGSTIRRNLVSATGGSTHAGYTGNAFGINAAHGVDVIDNTVEGVAPIGDAWGAGWATGIYTYQNTSGAVTGNRVRNVVGKDVGTDHAIRNVYNGRMNLVGNVLSGSGRSNSYGIECQDGEAVAAGNVVNGFTYGIYLCTDGGGNFQH